MEFDVSLCGMGAWAGRAAYYWRTITIGYLAVS